jgi:hypothetical protein
MYYLLDKNKIPYKIMDINEQNLSAMAVWGINFNKKMRILQQNHRGKIFISTIFLGIDHSDITDEPVLFETMIFGGKHNHEQWRYITYKEAITNHYKVLNELFPRKFFARKKQLEKARKFNVC